MQVYSKPLPDHLNKPAILPGNANIREIGPGTAFAKIKHTIDKGHNVCLTGTYGFAMSFYSWLKKQVAIRFPIHDYPSSRVHKKEWHTFQSAIWIRLTKNSPVLRKAPDNPWLVAFYPGKDDFLIRFSDFLGMNGARQWYEQGIRYPYIDHKLHPFYGVYFPTRHQHLALFDRWLDSNNVFRRAVDIGTGCGILSFIMKKYGLRKIHATDINPNAIYGLQEELHRQGLFGETIRQDPGKELVPEQSGTKKPGASIFPEQADLLGSFRPAENDLVVCNPPWIPQEPETPLDQACYYPPGFFPRFFRKMTSHCEPGATLALLFSDYALAAGITETHPIKEALNTFRKDFKLIACEQQPVAEKAADSKTWIQEIRNKENTELFVLRKTQGESSPS